MINNIIIIFIYQLIIIIIYNTIIFYLDMFTKVLLIIILFHDRAPIQVLSQDASDSGDCDDL